MLLYCILLMLVIKCALPLSLPIRRTPATRLCGTVHPFSSSSPGYKVSSSGWIESITLTPPTTLPPPSPTSLHFIRSRPCYLKRDDLYRLPSNLSGNKSRKFLSLSSTPLPPCIASHGGPQSNAMLALASIANYNAVNFTYYVKTLPRHLRTYPTGNLMRATTLGMNLVQLTHSEYEAHFSSEEGMSDAPPTTLQAPNNKGTLFIPQGGAVEHSRYGCHQLAREIVEFWDGVEEKKGGLSVVIPSGTGTTAYYTHQYLALNNVTDINVLAVPCVGSAQYLKRQMKRLAGGSNATTPTVLKSRNKYTFAKPHKELLEVWRELQVRTVAQRAKKKAPVAPMRA